MLAVCESKSQCSLSLTLISCTFVVLLNRSAVFVCRSADDNMSIEMTKLVVGPSPAGPPSPGAETSGRVQTRPRRRSKAASSMEAMGHYMTASPLLLKSFRNAASDREGGGGMLPPIGAARSLRIATRSHTSIGTADADERSAGSGAGTGHGHPDDLGSGDTGKPVRPASSLGTGQNAAAEKFASTVSGSGIVVERSTSSLASTFAAARRRLPAKDVREWIRFFYAEAEMRESAAALLKSREKEVSPYALPLPFRPGPS